jgi:hypothetical protein
MGTEKLMIVEVVIGDSLTPCPHRLMATKTNKPLKKCNFHLCVIKALLPWYNITGSKLRIPKANLKKVICQGFKVWPKYLVIASLTQLTIRLSINQRIALK